jgi:hypothetical protein
VIQADPAQAPTIPQPIPALSLGGDHSLVDAKTQQLADNGVRYDNLGRPVISHVGGSLGSGRFEGIGFSTRGPQEALQECCFYGIKPMVASSVKRGAGGWYATALFR